MGNLGDQNVVPKQDVLRQIWKDYDISLIVFGVINSVLLEREGLGSLGEDVSFFRVSVDGNGGSGGIVTGSQLCKGRQGAIWLRGRSGGRLTGLEEVLQRLVISGSRIGRRRQQLQWQRKEQEVEPQSAGQPPCLASKVDAKKPRLDHTKLLAFRH
ncbi:hypothetical protein KCU65_g90, partial [Aureobasidium melanogenum]